MGIDRAVILCGGMGTRFLPVTKCIPKEMLPIVDRPAVDYIVDEILDAGIRKILIVTNPCKDIMKEYYKSKEELYAFLRSKKNPDIETVEKLDSKADISWAVQSEAGGSGDAVKAAEEFCCEMPFILAYGDDLFYSRVSVARQLAEEHSLYGGCVVAAEEIPMPQALRYGVIESDLELSRNSRRLTKILEKPDKKSIKTPSCLCLTGRFALNPDIFDALRVTKPAANGELQLTDAINLLAAKGVSALRYSGKRYDLGSKSGSVRAIIEYALRRGDIGKEIKEYLTELAGCGDGE